MWIKNRDIDLYITDKDERTFPLLFGVLSYLIGTVILFIEGAPAAVTVLMFCYFSNVLLTIFITFFRKSAFILWVLLDLQQRWYMSLDLQDFYFYFHCFWLCGAGFTLTNIHWHRLLQVLSVALFLHGCSLRYF